MCCYGVVRSCADVGVLVDGSVCFVADRVSNDGFWVCMVLEGQGRKLRNVLFLWLGKREKFLCLMSGRIYRN